MKILTVLGARPQFVKASIISAFIRDEMPSIEEVVVHTGQHFDVNMSDVFFNQFKMTPPQYNLGVNGGSHGDMTGRMLSKIEKVLLMERPDVTLVYGDTNSTLAGALAAAKLHIPVAHVESGLRSFNIKMPEEINRILTDHIGTWLFTPTQEATDQLTREGLDHSRIFQVGDVMYDVAIRQASQAEKIEDSFGDKLGVPKEGYVLVTIHRAENTEDPARLKAIVEGLIRVASDLPVIWPLHPRTRNSIVRNGLFERLSSRITLIEPLGYLEMTCAEKLAAIIATDSGGVQKEAFFHRVPCVTLRDETEWQELVQSGWNHLVPPVSSKAIADGIIASIGRKGEPIMPYGDGNASKKIILTIGGKHS